MVQCILDVETYNFCFLIINREIMQNILWTDHPLIIDDAIAENYRKEQALWEKEIFPIGNGRLGCTVFGEPKRERVQFNQDSLWLGNEDNTGGYQPFGDIYIEFNDGKDQEFSNYRRELDIDRALQTITYNSNGINYRREYFSSYPAQLIVMRLSADKPGKLNGKVSMGNVHKIPIKAEDNTLVMAGDTSSFWWWQFILDNPERLIAGREYSSNKNIDLDFEARVHIINEGGELKTVNDSIIFNNCDNIVFLLAADTNYLADREKGWKGEHPHEKLCSLISKASEKTYEELFQEHFKDYNSIFHRVKLDIGEGNPELMELTTGERLKNYKDAVKNEIKPLDHDLEILLYQFARYLMISSSRQGHGALPTNLQGIWLISKHPIWRCDFHTDINVQMNYWFTSAANLTDCFEPFAKWINSIREVRKEETRKVLGVKRGWLTRSENGVFGGSTWHFQKGDSAWLCQNLWDHFTFTQDKEYLKNLAYPIMKEIAEFWLDHLKELPNGKLVAPDGRSPEHGPVGVDGVTYDQVLCWDLFSNTIAASKVLDIDDNLRNELSEKLKRLIGPKIGHWGQLQEWMDDIDDPEDDHRHINHLICVYPGRQVTPPETPELAKAAKISLTARRDHDSEHPAWSRVWKACMFSRLLDGEAAYLELKKMISTKLYNNLLAVHPPFQIDANFGYAAAVNEMLVQSHQSVAESFVIHLLPALPQAWKSGEVRGLLVRGAGEIDMAWKNGKLIKANLNALPNANGKWVVKYNQKTKEISLKPGEKICLID